jgi:hypothetical protein
MQVTVGIRINNKNLLRSRGVNFIKFIVAVQMFVALRSQEQTTDETNLLMVLLGTLPVSTALTNVAGLDEERRDLAAVTRVPMNEISLNL